IRCNGGWPPLHTKRSNYNTYGFHFFPNLAIHCIRGGSNQRFLRKIEHCGTRQRWPPGHGPQKWGETGGQNAKTEGERRRLAALRPKVCGSGSLPASRVREGTFRRAFAPPIGL